MKLLAMYTNGNYTVSIFDDGTKVRENDLDFFKAAFPESMDVKITSYCDLSCPYCYEDSSTLGRHGDILGPAFIDTIHPFTEVAIGGGNPLSHPDLVPFLCKLKDRNIIANLTVNQRHFLENIPFLKILTDAKLIMGLGVSFTQYTDGLVSALRYFPNAVLHVINGVVHPFDLSPLYGKDLKLLILGYKFRGRGLACSPPVLASRQTYLSGDLPDILRGFKVVAFDNLAIRQLCLRYLLSSAQWTEFYMGDDGEFTMYVDLVDRKFAKSSVALVRYDLLDDVDTMFRIVNTSC